LTVSIARFGCLVLELFDDSRPQDLNARQSNEPCSALLADKYALLARLLRDSSDEVRFLLDLSVAIYPSAEAVFHRDARALSERLMIGVMSSRLRRARLSV